MKAVALRQFGGVENFYLAEMPVPEPQRGEIRITTKAVAFNPSDYQIRQGHLGGDLPIILGRELSGVVDAVGEGVTDFALNDEVMAYLGGRRSSGSYAECVCVPVEFVSYKPKNLSFAQAAAIPVTTLTAYECVEKAQLQRGDSVFIAGGSGGVGSMAIRLAQMHGAQPILTTAGSDTSARYLIDSLSIPSEHILRYSRLTLREMERRLLQMNGNKGVHAAFDFVGGDMKRLCSNIVDFDGHVISIVSEGANFTLDEDRYGEHPLFAKSASFHYVLLYARAVFGEPEMWRMYQQRLDTLRGLFEEEHLPPPVVTDMGKFSVNTVQDAHRQLEGGHVQGKLVMHVD